MGIGEFQFGGLASGLDTNAIVSAVVNLESRPIGILQSQREEEQTKLSLIGTFEGLVDSLQAKAQELVEGSAFLASSLSVGTEGIASFEVSSGALGGSHELEVISLAKANRFTFEAYTDPDESRGTGDITFDYDGTSYTVSITDASLTEIAAAINSATDDELQASVINVGTDGSPSYQLVIAATSTGVDFAIENLTIGVGIDLRNQQELTPASNAEVLIDGLSVQRSTNVFSDVIAGVTFTVNQEATDVDDSNPTTTFTIDNDIGGTRENLQEFIDAYNAVQRFINQQNEFSEEQGAGGELFGDSILNTVNSAIRNALFDVDLDTVSNDTEGFSTLGLLGVEIDSDNLLSLDSARIDDRLDTDIQAFSDFFTDEDSGVLVKLDDAIKGLKDRVDLGGDLGTAPGVFGSRRDAIDTRIRDIDDSIERNERRIEQLEESLIRRFAALEELIGGLNAQGAFLANGLPQA